MNKHQLFLRQFLLFHFSRSYFVSHSTMSPFKAHEFTNLTSDFEKSGCAIASLATDDGRTIHIGTLSPSIPYEWKNTE